MHGEPLTEEALIASKNADAVLFGAVGGPVRHLDTLAYPILPTSGRQTIQDIRQPITFIEMGYQRSPSRARLGHFTQGTSSLRKPTTCLLHLRFTSRSFSLEARDLP